LEEEKMINSSVLGISGSIANVYTMTVDRAKRETEQVSASMSGSHTEEYWTPERMANASMNPVEIPYPETPAETAAAEQEALEQPKPGETGNAYWTPERMANASMNPVEIPYPETPAETAAAEQEALEQPIEELQSEPVGPSGGIGPVLPEQSSRPTLTEESWTPERTPETAPSEMGRVVKKSGPNMSVLQHYHNLIRSTTWQQAVNFRV
jgi:hypothetical protein